MGIDVVVQLPLALRWPDLATLDNFFIGDNAQAIAHILQMTQGQGERCIYLYGRSGVGLSHLLYAACHEVQRLQHTAAYIPLQKTHLSPQLVEGMEQLALLCWDDIDAIAGQRAWEEALFHCYNRAQTSGSRLLIAAHAPPTQIAWSLPDLGSRLAASVTLALKPLQDEQKVQALQQRAKNRGMELSHEVGNYLLTHGPRDMHALFATLETLDQVSLSTQRRLTIPLVKSVLS